MKKIFLIIIGIALIGCEKEEIPNSYSQLAGTWQWKAYILNGEVENYDNGDYYNKIEYKFYSDKTYEYIMYFMNEETEKIEGYHSMEIGTYEIIGDSIYRKFDLYYSNGTTEYEVVQKEDLILYDENIEVHNFYNIENDSNLTFKFNTDTEQEFRTTDRKFVRLN
tara:strand:+ start:90 stop:584 length:495 start_codon:yes stop_codon:yes gene_type:complete